MLLALGLTHSVARAEAGIESTSVGLGGRFAIGRLSRLTASVVPESSGEHRLVVVAPDPHGNPVEFSSEPVQLTEGKSETVTAYFYIGQIISTLTVRLDGTDGPVSTTRISFGDGKEKQPPPLMPGARLIGCLGQPAGLAKLALPPDKDDPTSEKIEIIQLTASDFPADARGLDAVNTLIVTGDYELSDSQLKALAQWLHRGGHLLVSVSEQLESYTGSSLGRYLQKWIKVEDQQERVSELVRMQSFVTGAPSIVMTAPRVPIAQLGEEDATVPIRAPGGLPLITNRNVGFGHITCVAVDLASISDPTPDQIASHPVLFWDGLSAMMEKLVTGARGAVREYGVKSKRIGYVGVTDLATQLQNAQVDFPEVKRASSWLVMGLILGYLAIIGPLDYLIVHRLLKRPRLTWFTFPLMVVGGCALGVYLADQSNGKTTLVNETSIVDIDTVSNTCRSNSWVSVYTPVARKSTVKATVSSDLRQSLALKQREPALLTWAGIPETTFGGMLRSSGIGFGTTPYVVGPDEASNVPMPVWSTSDLRTTWFGETAPPIKSALRLTGNRMLDGSITHSFGSPIRNWSIVHNRRIYIPRASGDRVSEIPANRLWPVKSGGVRGRAIESELTRSRVVILKRKLGEGGETSQNVQATYDPLSRDMTSVMRMLSLHEAAGGTAYTGLTNSLLTELDLSRVASEANIAILIGEIDVPGLNVALDGEPTEATKHRTFVRVLLPVEESEEEAN